MVSGVLTRVVCLVASLVLLYSRWYLVGVLEYGGFEQVVFRFVLRMCLVVVSSSMVVLFVG